jgi:hypothetical protein
VPLGRRHFEAIEWKRLSRVSIRLVKFMRQLALTLELVFLSPEECVECVCALACDEGEEEKIVIYRNRKQGYTTTSMVLTHVIFSYTRKIY